MARAVNLAVQEEKFDQAIVILDGFNEQEREQLNSAWEDWRWEYASLAAIARLKNDDRYGMNRIIASTPDNLRSFVQIAIANELAARGDRNGTIEFLEEGRKGLARLNRPDLVDWRLSLTRRYLEIMPQEAPHFFVRSQ
ncbi:MAG: hypothetical protein H0U18_02930 [Pyrinomonadaceae bacterium]|jgi:hypothetical protein|nr:hypothetical protein [Pyrinomonadaceae bacterium]